MKRLTDRLRRITTVRTRTLHLNAPFAETAARFAREAGAVVLLSGGNLDCSRYHMMGLRPWLSLVGRYGETEVFIDGDSVKLNQSPLDVLETVLAHCRMAGDNSHSPVTAGLFGYLAYDLKNDLERLPRTAVDDLGLPRLYLSAPSIIVVQDKRKGTTTLHAPVRQGQSVAQVDAAIDTFVPTLAEPPAPPGDFSGFGRSFESNFSRAAYMAAVQRIREYIAAGDVYQVNMSQRFEMGFTGDTYSLFLTLYDMNPAPFFAYINAGDHQIVSTSPERFLQCKGRDVETRPIKGTRPRGKTPDEDEAMKAELAGSTKDDAELSMIVDLLRNDIGKVCTGGSVIVSQHKRLEAYQNVYHLVSVVEGVLAEGRTSVDLIRATFPGGSITGCPKIRSMEIIDELESRCRHVYTGSIGYISFHDSMDLSIAIRTATITGNRIVFSVGGGIVFDSDPEDEFEETLHKGNTLMSVFQGTGERQRIDPDATAWVWQNGRLIPQNDAAVPISDLGIQYGFGFFETIRVESGHICHLPAHLNRFNRTWLKLFPGSPPDLTWQDIISQVVEMNGLMEMTAAVKMVATRGDESRRDYNGTLLVTARPYTHRLSVLGAAGLTLVTYPHPRMTPLADYKTLNYLYYYNAAVWAREQNADEAVILNPDGTLSETNTANILVLSGQSAIRPRSPHVLPGVMQGAVCQRLNELGVSIETRSMRADAVPDDAMILLTNALMGAVQALSLDGRPLRHDHTLIASINSGLFLGK